MRGRAELIGWLRGEIVGPSPRLRDPAVIPFADRVFHDSETRRRGPVVWRPNSDDEVQEILYYEQESPHRKYGAGLLHPEAGSWNPGDGVGDEAAGAPDTLGFEPADEFSLEDETVEEPEGEEGDPDIVASDASDDLDIIGADSLQPSTIGISFCVRLPPGSRVKVRLPQSRHFAWQAAAGPPFLLNGRYERCVRRWKNESGLAKDAPMWRRQVAVLPDTVVAFDRSEFEGGRPVRRDVSMPPGSPMALRIEVFPRRPEGRENSWLLTVVLRNVTVRSGEREPRESVLYQTYFEVLAENGAIEKYPESQRPFEHLDPEEQSLALLYRESATWGVGHGCAAAWDADPGAAPLMLFADVMPAVELPSTTPDISDGDGNPVRLSMRGLAGLSDDGGGAAWQSLSDLAAGYASWIALRRSDAAGLPGNLRIVAEGHLAGCSACLDRLNAGIALLRADGNVRRAFRLANLSMLLQQISTKQLARRGLAWNEARMTVGPSGAHRSPWDIYAEGREDVTVGSWRAFQIAFLLMSLRGIVDTGSEDRQIVDLIWFPTGGGKTEAYLGVMAFHMFHERLIMDPEDEIRRDGTNVLMRYTLRMLTTQQFQRAASLVCAMEFLRRMPEQHGIADILGRRFSLGLWIGGDGTPNRLRDAKGALEAFRRGTSPGNPLVLTECPWCRAEIGRFDGPRPRALRISETAWNSKRTCGISEIKTEGPLLHCTDGACEFGAEAWQRWLPVEVIDERIYQAPPSLVIATADKLAIVAYRPEAGAIFGRRRAEGVVRRESHPPSLIIQDELHLISGPLGTMYALYETIFERLCSGEERGALVRPKIIASTATIRGAADQVKALYARSRIQLFPSPGLLMSDSFFGTYAKAGDGPLADGRLYLGIHATNYGSFLTTQVRAFSSALFLPWTLVPERRDPWWSLLTFFNSIRDLGGARTLFDSDIRSRLKFIFNREDFPAQDRRTLRAVEELTARLSQAEIVGMMDRLAVAFSPSENKAVDVCLASSIIEVGVDIDRLSLMGVVGQPKTTAQYIQVTGRIGRRWWERPGLVLMLYNPAKSRDRSHFEQFHSYHRRLYERVEPTSATPFATAAIQRALPGAAIAWARQQSDASVNDLGAYRDELEAAHDLLKARASTVQAPADVARSCQELERGWRELERKWAGNPQRWEDFPPAVDGEYLMLWPGQFATRLQKDRGVIVASSMRQVDGSAELEIDRGYALDQSVQIP